MKISYNFTKDTRSFELEAEDELEKCLLNDMAERCQKGSSISIAKVQQDIDKDCNSYPGKVFAIVNPSYRVEMRINGK